MLIKSEQYLALKLFMILSIQFEFIICGDFCEVDEINDCHHDPLRTYGDDVLVLTVASEPTDGYERYTKSARFYKIDFKTLGLGEKWQGGDMNYPGGGYKIKLLKDALEPYKNNRDKIVLFTDSYDVVFLSPLADIVRKFKSADARIVFGAEHLIWPDESLKEKYPKVTGNEVRFLNSGLFIGYASDIYEMLQFPVKNTDDDQLYYTKIYLDEDFRKKHNMKLDQRSDLFQNLNGASAAVQLEIDTETGASYLVNTDFETKPSIVHGNGPSKMKLNSLSNYLIDTFEDNICTSCSDKSIELDEQKLPIVSMSIFIENPMPFFEEFLDKILSLNYPKENIHLLFHNNVKFHKDLVKTYVEKFGGEYKSVKTVNVEDSVNESDARDLAIKHAINKESDYFFVIDNDVHLDNPDILRKLIKENRHFIAPLMTRPGQVWSNFWGALSENGFYARSNDYMDIVNNHVRGIWNVPFVSSIYLIKKSIFSKVLFKHENFDPDMAMCHHLRHNNVFMNIINLDFYGHLVNGEKFNTKYARPDFYMLLTNQADWEQRYIHQDYLKHLDPNSTAIQPCTDVYWFPITTDQFCDDLVAIMEDFGKWSSGTNTDKRLEGGYEAVPTRDIHMNQVGLEPLWLKFLYLYVRPLQEKVFLGYYHDPPRSLMNFVVRYKPDEQPYLRPHHDSSTYTINIALNHAGIDFEGGGCNFIRYNCSVQSTKKGWMLMHPGRLTHFHEGLRVNKGIRYIMISFVDP